MELSSFIKVKRRQINLTQPEFVEKVGVCLHFIRESMQGKTLLRLEKVNQEMHLFGHDMSPKEL